MMWSVEGIQKGQTTFGSFEPEEVLVWHDGPRSFSLLDPDQGLCFAHWLDEDDRLNRFGVAQINKSILEKLKTGQLSIFDALNQPRFFVVDQTFQGIVENVIQADIEKIPEKILPDRRVMIRRDLEPIICVRAKGKKIIPGEIPGSVIRATVEGTQKALRLLAEHEFRILEERKKTSRVLKDLWDLSAQRFLAASFEVQFKWPFAEKSLFDDIEIEEKNLLEKISEHLNIGFKWAQDEKLNLREAEHSDKPDLQLAILEATRCLTPPTRGAIEEIEIRGGLINQTKPIHFTRETRRHLIRAKGQVNNKEKHEFKEISGKVIDIYGEEARILISDSQEQERQSVCQFSEDLWEEVGETIHFNQKISFLGLIKPSEKTISVYEVLNFPE